MVLEGPRIRPSLSPNQSPHRGTATHSRQLNIVVMPRTSRESATAPGPERGLDVDASRPGGGNLERTGGAADRPGKAEGIPGGRSLSAPGQRCTHPVRSRGGMGRVPGRLETAEQAQAPMPGGTGSAGGWSPANYGQLSQDQTLTASPLPHSGPLGKDHRVDFYDRKVHKQSGFLIVFGNICSDRHGVFRLSETRPRVGIPDRAFPRVAFRCTPPPVRERSSQNAAPASPGGSLFRTILFSNLMKRIQ